MSFLRRLLGGAEPAPGWSPFEEYEQARPTLRIRLMPDASMGGVEVAGSVVRAITPGILAVLVYDFPGSTASVHEEHLASWPVDAATAFDQALVNLDQEPLPLSDDMEVEPETSVRVWYGDSLYVATRLLRLTELLPPGTTDALVAVPNRHTLLVHPIVDGGAVSAMQPMYRLAVQLFREGPGSISDQPYWWHEGALEQIPHQAKGSNVTVVPPEGLFAVFEAVIARTEGR